MGLDIYVYRYEDYDLITKVEAEYEEKSTQIWKDIDKGRDYKELTEVEKNEARQKCDELKTQMGLGEYGEHPLKTQIEINSTKYPDHYFKIGYFRSSYNGGGINRILENAIGKRLEDIFQGDDDDYCFRPDWERSKNNLATIANEFKQAIEVSGGVKAFAEEAVFISGENGKVNSEKEALDIYLQEKQKHKESSFTSYSNHNGSFYMGESLKVKALIKGIQWRMPCLYVVFEGEMDWYLQALEIIGETIDWVLSQPDTEKYYLHWSS